MNTHTQPRARASHMLLLETQFDAMVNRLAVLRPPVTDNAGPEEIRALVIHMREIADAVDYYFERIGGELAMNAPGRVDISLFMRQLHGAIDGNAVSEINRVAALIEENERS
jgi:hypothetical protein